MILGASTPQRYDKFIVLKPAGLAAKDTLHGRKRPFPQLSHNAPVRAQQEVAKTPKWAASVGLW